MTLTSDPATPFGESDTIVAYASSKAAVTMISLQYANAFRRHPSHSHIKIDAATPGHIATDVTAMPARVRWTWRHFPTAAPAGAILTKTARCLGDNSS
jgi:NAD(P)-dependent dehydrogenase (short-subunit alcohol dehydrogenase family)